MTNEEPDPSKLRIIPIDDGRFRWALFSDDPAWLALSDRGTGIIMRFESKKAAHAWKDYQIARFSTKK